ncbi:hypothetical protein [Vibrio gazogenes]|nr:hypothetical protein [Vibrio gazogenes]USP14493.1 hypothetical protein MKS89_04005 [Vibrio gazogenes]
MPTHVHWLGIGYFMASRHVAGLFFILIIIAISLANASAYVGDIIEQSLEFLGGIITVLVLIGLFGVWRDIKIFKEKEFKLIGLSYPVLIICETIYPVIEYSEQRFPEYWWGSHLLELLFSLYVLSIFISKKRKA